MIIALRLQGEAGLSGFPDFFSRASDAFAIVAGGEMRLRSSIILRRGIVREVDPLKAR
jgi:L-fucose mutarotase/ribose pyranase (RbsD/FucU family)